MRRMCSGTQTYHLPFISNDLVELNERCSAKIGHGVALQPDVVCQQRPTLVESTSN